MGTTKVDEQSIARQSSDGLATIGQLPNNSSSDISLEMAKFKKIVAERSRDSRRSSRDRQLTVEQFYFDVSAKMSTGDSLLSTKFCPLLRLLGKLFERVAEQSRDSRRRSLPYSEQFGTFLKKNAERSRNSVRSSRDLRPTVKQLSLDYSANKKDKIMKNVAERSRDSDERSRDRRSTVKQLF